MSPTMAWAGNGTVLMIDGVQFDQVITVTIDHATRRIRGRAISSSSDLQVRLRNINERDSVHVALNTRERTEYLGPAKVLMYRTRCHWNEAISISFVFQLEESVT